VRLRSAAATPDDCADDDHSSQYGDDCRRDRFESHASERSNHGVLSSSAQLSARIGGYPDPSGSSRQPIRFRYTYQWQADLHRLEASVVNSILLQLAGPPGGAGSQHGMSVPVWFIVAAVVVIVVVVVVGILRRRR
jgi:hypothetical protein